MKKLFSVMMLAAVLFSACSDDNGGGVGGGETLDGLVFIENGVYYLGNGNKEYITPKGDYKLDASHIYHIRGWVYITEGSTLTIPAGTILKGVSETDQFEGSSLIIERDAKIYARETATNPIVFTSDKEPGKRKPGDWGGIIICGNAPNNRGSMQIEGGPRSEHGGSDPNDDSGVFTYCRIEFAGYPYRTDMEINGLTLGSVGDGTKIDHVQVSYSNDDSYEWFGGTVNCSHLVAYHGWDDDFDTDNGFSGTLQYLLSVRHPKIADQSLSNGFESDNCSDGTVSSTSLTSAKFANVTLVGPIGQDDAFYNIADAGGYITAGHLYPNNGSRVGQYQAGIQIRRSSNISVYNTAVIGWPVGIMIDNDKSSSTQDLANASPSRFGNLFFAGYTDNAIASYDNTVGASPILGSDRNKSYGDWYNNTGELADDVTGQLSFSHDFITNVVSGTRLFSDISDLGLKDPVSVANISETSFDVNKTQNYGPTAGSPLKGSFPLPSGNGFDSNGSTFIGAFASDSDADNWMLGWTEFDPQNAKYE